MHYSDLMAALKGEAEFYFMANTWRSWRDDRFKAVRAIPEGAHFVPFYEPGKYDFAILGIDQQCLNPALGKSRVYRELNEAIQDIPKVVINHGSPIFPEFFKQEMMNDEEAKAACVAEMKIWLEGNKVVVNSYKAAEEWELGHPIWHGIDGDEWTPLDKEPRVITALSPGGLDIYYNRYCMEDFIEIMLKEYGYDVQWARKTRYANTGDSVDKYKEFLGRGLIYVDTSIDTPMNRGRTEAMLSECCVVQVEGAHDLERFAVDGENMVLVPNNPNEIAKKVYWLLNNPDEAKRIGENGRKTALEKFNRARYKKDWLEYIKTI